MARWPGALFVSAGGYHHHLGLNTWASRGAPRPPADAAGLRLWTLHTADAEALAALRERLTQAGVAVRELAGALVFDDPGALRWLSPTTRHLVLWANMD